MKEIKKSASLKSKVKGKETPFNIDLNYSSEYDSFNIKVKKGEGFMSYTDALQSLPLGVVQKLNEMLEEVLIKAGSKYEMKEHKMFDGGNFQSGVYAKGGSLDAHGIHIGDTFLKTVSGTIQKVKDKNGNIVYINLANGERDSQPPLPFEYGGGLGIEEEIDLTDDKKLRVRKPAMPTKELTRQEWAEKHNASAYEYMGKSKMANGGGVGLIGNQKRIDINHNGKIDAEDFKLLRSSMNGASINDRKHVNHNEDYEVRYARNKPNRTGYKGKRNFADGGSIKMVDGKMYEKVKFSNGIEDWYRADLLHRVNFYCSQNGLNPNNQKDFEKALENVSKKSFSTGGKTTFKEKSSAIAKKFEGKRVEPKYQKEYGKVYSKEEAKEVGNKITGSMVAKEKMATGGETKKGAKGGIMVLAKQIRKEGESWKDALKRAGQQLK